jgi:peptidoglycan/LPS O-acetylase OafA/YrhL
MATTHSSPMAVRRPTAEAVEYNIAIGYLRGFLVALVVAHHAVLAYHPFAPQVATSLVEQPRWWQAFPVLDNQRWAGFGAFAGFNDVFFMALMFFVSGLFVWRGLKSKGALIFLRPRLLRLGVPFLVVAAVVAPLAYYPAYLQTGGHEGFNGFVRTWLSLEVWPSGPAWFLWVLLTFDAFAALLFALIPGWGERLARLISGVSRRPALFFAVLVCASAAVYIPLALVFSPIRWSAFGPFSFQTSRILNYLLYFAVGVGVGACGLEEGLLARGGRLARRWYLWAISAVLAFVAASIATIAAMSNLESQALAVLMNAGFVLSCAASGFAFLALFARFFRSRSRLFDSLSRNSYGIYIVHYAFVSWVQYALLPASLPAAAKGLIVSVAALGLSWVTTSVLRRIPAVARVV